MSEETTLLTKEEFIQRLVEAGWDRLDAEQEYEIAMGMAEEEDGYDGP